MLTQLMLNKVYNYEINLIHDRLAIDRTQQKRIYFSGLNSLRAILQPRNICDFLGFDYSLRIN